MGYCVINNGRRSCITCKEIKLVGEFYRYKYKTKQGKDGERYDSRCKQCCRKRRRARYAVPELGVMDRAASLAWKKINNDKVKAYVRKKQVSSPEFRAKKAKHQRLRKARIRASSNNNDQAIKDIYQLAVDAEKKLVACVECDDPLEIKMHVDHIVPLSRGGKHIATNLQVISAKANLKKGSRIIPAMSEEVAPHG